MYAPTPTPTPLREHRVRKRIPRPRPSPWPTRSGDPRSLVSLGSRCAKRPREASRPPARRPASTQPAGPRALGLVAAPPASPAAVYAPRAATHELISEHTRAHRSRLIVMRPYATCEPRDDSICRRRGRRAPPQVPASRVLCDSACTAALSHRDDLCHSGAAACVAACAWRISGCVEYEESEQRLKNHT